MDAGASPALAALIICRLALLYCPCLFTRCRSCCGGGPTRSQKQAVPAQAAISPGSEIMQPDSRPEKEDSAGAGREASRDRGFLVAAIALGLITWRVAFNLGAYGTVFYEDIDGVIVASTIALVASFLGPQRLRARAWPGRVLLAAPMIWTIVALILTGSLTAAESSPAFVALGIIVGVTSVPYILLLLARVAVPSLELFTADGSLPWFL
jgi:hypothetical protein